MRAQDAPEPGAYLYLTTLDGEVLMVQYLGLGGTRFFEDKGARHPWVQACGSVGIYGRGERFRTGWERLSRRRPRKQNSQ